MFVLPFVGVAQDTVQTAQPNTGPQIADMAVVLAILVVGMLVYILVMGVYVFWRWLTNDPDGDGSGGIIPNKKKEVEDEEKKYE